ncbi:hypothetical protein DSM104299_01987 [Baekduia alba]|uniref:hypothetical protein n=1 Tax=Baekduia alba TaxID=2997333 RepID=UPI0023425BC5|nr:hypothetical protein [Baekduia alba]WCB93275.1 hypothetical protein DSM104299_01987 [Baekduia alba]
MLGTPTEGATLQVGGATWTGTDPMTYAYQWQLCDIDGVGCRDIDGATSETYVVPAEQYGRPLRVAVTATNVMGQTTAYSAATDAVGAGEMPEASTVPSVTIIGAAGAGSVVTTDGGTWQNADRDQLTDQWLRCDADGTDCLEIDDAVGDSYRLTAEDASHRLEVEVTATTDAGEAKAISDTSDLIASTPAPTLEGEITYLDHGRTQVAVSAPDGSGRATAASCAQLVGVGAGCQLYGPRISPTLGMIVFEARSDANNPYQGSIWLVNADGTGLRKLTTGGEPSWTPDASRIIFTQPGTNGSDTQAVSVGADGLHTDDPEPAVMAPEVEGADPDPGGGGGGGASLTNRSLSPASTLSVHAADVADDGRIVFVGTPANSDPRLYVAEDRTDATPRLLDFGGKFALVDHPRFLPDGHAIAFTARLADGSFDGDSIWEVDTDGAGLHRVSPKDRKLYGPPAPTSTEVLTTRSDFEICSSPTLAARTGSPAARTYTYDICGVSGTRAYAINHDGSHPHFLGPDDVDDLDAPVAHAASTTKTAKEIYVEEGLDRLNRYANQAAGQAAKRQFEKEVFEETLHVVVRVSLRATVVGDIVAFLTSDGDLDCEAGGFEMRAKSTFVSAGSLLDRIASASIGSHPALHDRATASAKDMATFLEDAQRQYQDVPHDCKVFYKAAVDSAERVVTALQHADEHLTQLDFEHLRIVEEKEAREPGENGRPIGTRNCEEAEELVDELGRGAGRRNHVVYWSPPPPPDSAVDYVGRSRDFKQRCDRHPEERTDTMTTLNIPPMTLIEAQSTEEALIAHFGPFRYEANAGTGRDLGQLSNKRHEISPDRDTYCAQLLLGQFILLKHGYAAYAAAFYTGRKRCPGVGTHH